MKLTGSFWCNAVLIAALPVGITAEGVDSTETNFGISGGFGQYAIVSRGCENNVLAKQDVPFSEVGGSIDHKTRGPFRVGLRGHYINFIETSINQPTSYITIPRENILAFNPFINLEWDNFAIGEGYLYTSNPLPFSKRAGGAQSPNGTAYLRIGSFSGIYFEGSFLHSSQLVTGGYFRAGIGAGATPRTNVWFGLTFEPYDAVGFVMKTDQAVSDYFGLNILGRFGISDGTLESAISLELTYRMIHRSGW